MIYLLVLIIIFLLLNKNSNHIECYKSISKDTVDKIFHKIIKQKLYNFYNDIEIVDNTFFIDKRTNTFNTPYSVYLLTSKSGNIEPLTRI